MISIHLQNSGTYSEPNETSKMKLFANIVNSVQLLTIFAKSSILDVRLDSEYATKMSKGKYSPGSTILICVWLVRCFKMFEKTENTR